MKPNVEEWFIGSSTYTVTQTILEPREFHMTLEYPHDDDETPLYNGFNVYVHPETLQWFAYSAPSNNKAPMRLYNLIWGSYVDSGDDDPVVYVSDAACDYRQMPRTLTHLTQFLDYKTEHGYQFLGTMIFAEYFNMGNTIEYDKKFRGLDDETKRAFATAVFKVLQKHPSAQKPLRECAPCPVPAGPLSGWNNMHGDRHACERFRYGEARFKPNHKGGPFQEDAWKRDKWDVWYNATRDRA